LFNRENKGIMLSFLTKKKLTEDKLADSFVYGILQLVDEGFPAVAEMINADPEFETSPSVQAEKADKFLMIVLAGNLQLISCQFHDYRDVRLTDKMLSRLSSLLEIEKDKLKQHISSYQAFINRVNQPSKNTLYGMSKAVFYKYDLNTCQTEYFRKMNSPNPLFFKRLCDIMNNFVWEWDQVSATYKIVA
jgi:hypothetical protein